MEKSVMIIGPARSGKTKLAREIQTTYPATDVSWFNARLPKIFSSEFMFKCTEETKLIILDDIPLSAYMQACYLVMYLDACGVIIHRSGLEPIIIYPQFILTFDESVTRSHLMQVKGIKKQFEINDFHNQ